MDEKKTNIEKILAERMKLDEVLRSEFQRRVTIMFTDIKGSTSFYEQRGDLDGRLMVHRHNEIVIPCIEQNKGVLIKTIGDATMSRYDDPADGVRAALQIQLRLRDYNKASAAGEMIHVRIGLNTGLGIVEEKDVFGDVVNVAARVESLADGGEIFVTEDTYREVKNNDEFIFRFAKASQVRGKKEELKAYRLVWQEEHLNLGLVRGATRGPAKKEGSIVLDASVAGKSLKVSAYERNDGEERAVKNYKEVPYQEEKVRELSRSIVEVLNRANRRGKIGKDLLVKLRELAGMLFDQLVPVDIKDRLKSTGQGNLMLNIDDRLVHIPWELLFDGKEFLCHRFSVGRSVSTQQTVSAAVRALHRPLKMQILADPRGDLPAAYQEGIAIQNEVAKFEEWLDVTLKTTDITQDYAKGKIRNFDIVHYAGHAEHNTEHPEQSAWLLKDGKLTAAEIMTMAGSRPMPALVFSNACQTGQTDSWKLDENFGDRIFGVANAFLLSGVQHYIGTFWEIPDEAGSLFARSFYRSLVDGATVGEALRQARQSLIQKYGEDTIVWASYMLYGDPTTRYAVADAIEEQSEVTPEAKPETRPAEHAELVTATLRGGDAAVAVPTAAKNKTALYAGFGIAAVVLIAAIAIFGRGGGPSAPTVPQVLTGAQPAVQPASEDASRKRMDELVASLATQYREGKIDQPAKTTDNWSSRPVTMVFMDVKAAEAGGDNQVQLLASRVTQGLESEGRVQMVERELLTKLLEELKLSTSSLADQTTALKIGKLLSARIMIIGSILAEKKGLAVILRFIDTETTAVRKVLTVDVPSGSIDSAVAQGLATNINAWVKTDYPVQGRVTALSGETCMLNVGQAHGLKKGDHLEIVKEAKKGTGLYAVTGELEIIEPQKDQSQARIVSKMEPIKEGLQVRMKI